jgi:dipeptidyl aminopeptidase/acylaminoacyl peptidase
MLAAMRRLVPVIVVVLAVASGALRPSPAWATFPGRNGALIVAVSDAAGQGFQNVIEAVDPVSHSARVLLRCEQDGDECPYDLADPQVSPNGAKIALDGQIYTDSYTTDDAIELMPASGGALTNVPFFGYGDENDNWAAWFPSGDELAVEVSGDDQNSSGTFQGWFTETPTGRDQRSLLAMPGSDPAVAPNGRTLLFDRGDHLWRVSTDGSGPAELLAGASDPSWGPAGERFAAVRGGHVIVADANGTAVHQVAITGSDPVFSPQGDSVAYARFVKGVLDLYTVDARGGTSHLVFTQKVAPDGSLEGLSWQARQSGK